MFEGHEPYLVALSVAIAILGGYTGFGLAGMISPIVFGVLIQRTGRYDLPLFISAGLLLAGAVCSLNIDPTARVEAIPTVHSKARV